MTEQRAVAESQPEGDTEARILEAARRVFMLRGTAGARMQEIAAEAGVNQALLHYYFRTKDRLAEAVFREAAGRLAPTVLRILGSDEPIEAKVEQFVQAYIDAVRRHPFIPGYILAELHHHPERLAAKAEQAGGIPPAEIARALIGKLDVQLRTAAEAGALRPIAAAQFVVNLIALCVFPFAARPALTIGLGMDDGAFDRFLDERRASLPSFILSGLRP